jgi:hypothetical protein
MFGQVMRSIGYNTDVTELTEAMKYNNHPVADRIIAQGDAVLLQKMILMFERYVEKRGGKLREPFFWQNMAKLYTKAGNNDAAERSLKLFKKYKY